MNKIIRSGILCLLSVSRDSRIGDVNHASGAVFAVLFLSDAILDDL
tara:strand:- start:6103 stop:6240 length:138 start_codon:yes stop_codon:yes gene_type:complete